MKKKIIPIFLGVFLITLFAFGQISEYSVKAAYLFNFAKFVQWPPSAFADEKGPLVIGVLGDDPFGEELDKAVAGKIIGDHSIRIVRFDRFDPAGADEIRKCHILFIAYSEKDRLRQILHSLEGASVLTVSEIENFTLKGGDILFDQVGKRIGLVVNPEAAGRAKLKISAKLLQVSKIYKPEPRP